MFGKLKLFGTHVSGINLFGQEENVYASIEDDRIKFQSVLDKQKVASLMLDKITSARILTEKEIVEKDKSVVGRAVAGTLLAGPLGAIVGGISGVGSKKKKKNYRVLVINYSDDKSIVILEDKLAANFDKFNKELNKNIVTKELEL